MKDTANHRILEDDDASTDALLNEAHEWLAYARGAASLLAEWASEGDDEGNGNELSLALGGIAALVAIGDLCIRRAHTQVLFDGPLSRVASEATP